MSLRQNTIHRRLMTAFTLFAAATLTTAWLVGIVYFYMFEHEELRDNLRAQAAIVATQNTAAVMFFDLPVLFEELQSLSHYPVVTWAQFSTNEAELAHYGAPPPDAAQLLAALESGSGVVEHFGSMTVRQDIVHDGVMRGKLIVHADLGPLNRQFLWVAGMGGVMILALLLLAAGYFARALRSVSAPLEELAHLAMAAKADSQISARATIRGDDEIGRLAGAFNLMLDTLVERERSIRQQARLIEMADDPIMVWSREGEILYWNRGAEEMYGVTARSALGQSIDRVPGGDALLASADVRWGLDATGRWIGEVRRSGRDGQPLTVSVRLQAAEFNGREAVLESDRDISARKVFEQSLANSRDELRALTVRLQAVREEERGRIAHELHDELGQRLTALKLEAAAMTGAADFREFLGRIDQTIAVVRRISWELRPSVLDALGLVPAIEWLAQDFQRRMGVRCRVAGDSGGDGVEGELATDVFRLCQEILTNVARHAQASRVDIRLDLGERIVLEVEDNGRGMPAGDAMRSLGRLGMQERAGRWGGTIEFSEPPDGHGVRVRVDMPRPRRPENPHQEAPA